MKRNYKPKTTTKDDSQKKGQSSSTSTGVLFQQKGGHDAMNKQAPSSFLAPPPLGRIREGEYSVLLAPAGPNSRLVFFFVSIWL